MRIVLPNNIEQEALEAEQMWAQYCGADDAPDNAQMRVWIRSCGMPALRYAIPLAGWKKRKCAEAGQPIPPDGLQRYTSAACKRRANELGFVREYQQCSDAPRIHQTANFVAPQEWLEADNIDRYQPAEWEQS